MVCNLFAHARGLAAVGAGMALVALAAFAQDAPPAPKEHAPVPPPDVPGVVTLFGGAENDVAANWTSLDPSKPAPWKVADGAMISRGGDIMTKEKYQDFQLHVEFKEPYMPDKHGQERGNSGVYLQGRYEIQVLDSYGVPEPGKGDAGAVYNQSAPLVKAYRPPLEWQTYDIIFHQARLGDDGKVAEKARVTVLLNGVAIQNNTVIDGPTGGPLDKNEGTAGPIRLQDHGNPVQFRNIWILPLPLKGVDHY